MAIGISIMLIAAADCDGDGYSTPEDCNDQDADINPGAAENPDWIDSNCNGYEDVPIGFTREGGALRGGMASAVEWYGDYVYVAAAASLQVFYAPPGNAPILVHDIEMRDMGREMVRVRDVLFIANRGDGLLAFNLADPAVPQLHGRVSGFFEAPAQSLPVEAIFFGLDAKWDGLSFIVAVALTNNVPKATGGVDAAVFEYDPLCDPQGDCFTLLHAFDATEIRIGDNEMPLTVGLTDDADGLFIGYFGPEIAYVDLTDPSIVLNMNFGFVYDIQVIADSAYVASGKNSDGSILSRVRVLNGQLERDLIQSFSGLGPPGEAVDVHGDVLCFGVGGPDRDPNGNNLFIYTGAAQGGIPTLVAAAGTMDWIYQVACRDTGNGTGWAYVADEWAGLQFWELDGGMLTTPYDDNGVPEDDALYPPNHMRVPTGMFSHGMWLDPEGDESTIYSLKEGAGLWAFEMDATGSIQNERVAIEYIDVNDPGCNDQCVCSSYLGPDCMCCPPEPGQRPYPPALFTALGASSQGRLLILGHDRNEAVGFYPYLLMFREDDLGGGDYEYEAIWGEAIPWEMSFGLRTGVDGWIVKSIPADGYSIVLLSVETGDIQNNMAKLRIYQHCLGDDPAGPDDMRFLGEVEVPDRGVEYMLADAVLYNEYLFVTDLNIPSMSDGLIHAYQWRNAPLTSCDQTASVISPTPLGTFGETYNPNKLQIDGDGDRLIVGTAKTAAPNQDTALLIYDDLAGCFADTSVCFDDPAAGIETHRTVIDLQDQIVHSGKNRPDVRGIVLDEDQLHYVDYNNGLYTYSLATQTYTRFYPAHRPDMSNALLPELIRAPEEVLPIYNPIALEMIETQNGKKFIVQEHTVGRVSILVEED